MTQPTEPTGPQRLGLKIQAARTAKKLTQEDLSVHSGVSVSSIQRIEGGHTPTLQTLQTLADALGISMATLFD